MNNKVIYRQNNRFIIDHSFIVDTANKDEICSALYAAIYLEFKGAMYHKVYSKLSNLERIEEVNKFAIDWLKSRNVYKG